MIGNKTTSFNFGNFVRGFIIYDITTATCFPDEDKHLDEDGFFDLVKCAYLVYGRIPEEICKIDLEHSTLGDCI